MKNNPVCILVAILSVFLSISSIFGGCKSSEPVQVISVSNGPGLNTPGGPTVTITLKNISSVSIVYLLATLTLDPDNTVGPFQFVFKADSLNPLQPNVTISQTQILIGGGMNADQHYSLDIRGIFQGNGTFQFTQRVGISTSAAT